MRKKRQYLASYDTGHDYGSFTFESEARAGSNENMEDARRRMLAKYGRHASGYKIIRITLAR